MRASKFALAVAVPCGLLALFVEPVTARAATRSYPGAAPCNTTLQACITGATSGDRIEIANATQIAEDLTISKSLTLTSAAGVTGFIGGELVPQDNGNLHQITINEAAGGASTAVVISSLKLTANINLTFATGTGHSFALQHCQLVRPWPVPGVEGDLPLKVFSWLHVPSSIEVSDNTFIASDTSVLVQTDAGASDVLNINVLRNHFLGDAVSPESSSAVELQMDTGQINANIWSNLVHRDSEGAEGWGFFFQHNDYFGTTVGGVIDVTGNTVDLVNSSGTYGLLADGLGNFQFNLYDNIFSHMPDFGGEGTPMNARGNDFFDIGYFDPTQIQSPELQLFVDPAYVDRDNGDYHLSSTSALINAGFNAAPGGLPATDLDGHLRVVGGTVDVGAFEYAPPVGGEAGAGDEAGAPGDAGASTGGTGGSVVTGGAAGLGTNAGTGGVVSGGASSAGANSAGTTGAGATGGASTTGGGASSSAGEQGGGAASGGAASGGSNAGVSGSAGATGSNGHSSGDSGCSVRGSVPVRGRSWAPWFLAALAVVVSRRRKRHTTGA